MQLNDWNRQKLTVKKCQLTGIDKQANPIALKNFGGKICTIKTKIT